LADKGDVIADVQKSILTRPALAETRLGQGMAAAVE